MRYLLIQYLRKPGGQIDEQVTVSKKVKPTDISMCNVIMDYQTKKIDKCVIEGKRLDTDWEKMNEYYKKVYPALIEQLEKNNNLNVK